MFKLILPFVVCQCHFNRFFCLCVDAIFLRGEEDKMNNCLNMLQNIDYCFRLAMIIRVLLLIMLKSIVENIVVVEMVVLIVTVA